MSLRAFGFQGEVLCQYTIHATGGVTIVTDTVRLTSVRVVDTVYRFLPIPPLERGHYLLTVTAISKSDTLTLQSAIAIVFEPSECDDQSPWGIMYVPMTMPTFITARQEDQTAKMIALLGASWVRYNFWEHMYTVTKDPRNKIELSLGKPKRQILAFRKTGISILGEIVQTPRILSSQMDLKATQGDAGPMYSRVKPSDYDLWTDYVKKLTRTFKNDISTWEIWNEPEGLNSFWSGSAPEFVDIVKHTYNAIKEEHPGATVVAAGFVGTNITAKKDNLQTMFQQGIGKYMDMVSLHYTNDHPEVFDRWNQFLRNFHLDLKIINTEERSIIPLENLKRGIRSFKFTHYGEKYDSYIPLFAQDWIVTPAAVTYSVGAHLIGSKSFLREEIVGNFTVTYFGKNGDTVAVIGNAKNSSAPAILGRCMDSIKIDFGPHSHHGDIYDLLGRTVSASASAHSITIPFDVGSIENRKAFSISEPYAFIHGNVQIINITGIFNAAVEDYFTLEAEQGNFGKGWNISVRSTNSGGKNLTAWNSNDTMKNNYWVTLPFAVSRKGFFNIYFSGNSMYRLHHPETISPFFWSIDDSLHHAADSTAKVLYGILGAEEGLSYLGNVYLSEGKHLFTLQLHSPRSRPDQNWYLLFDALLFQRSTTD